MPSKWIWGFFHIASKWNGLSLPDSTIQFLCIYFFFAPPFVSFGTMRASLQHINMVFYPPDRNQLSSFFCSFLDPMNMEHALFSNRSIQMISMLWKIYTLNVNSIPKNWIVIYLDSFFVAIVSLVSVRNPHEDGVPVFFPYSSIFSKKWIQIANPGILMHTYRPNGCLSFCKWIITIF